MKQESRLKKWDELIRQKRYPGIQNFCALLGLEGIVSDRTLEADIRELKKILASKYTSLAGEFADIDHLISAQTDHRFRGKVTT